MLKDIEDLSDDKKKTRKNKNKSKTNIPSKTTDKENYENENKQFNF